ncbi:MAG: hypothetical protein LQ340_004104 [Diploschistes diacapsis]|nr:MAG: hypothetical protein LQ340_004104 [Diploschistes diacapsis]
MSKARSQRPFEIERLLRWPEAEDWDTVPAGRRAVDNGELGVEGREAACITPISATTGIFVAPIAVFTKKITGWDLYNSLCTIEALDSGPVIKRIGLTDARRQERDGEVNWGKFGSLLNPHTNLLNFFAHDKTGLKLAQWTFWSGTSFHPTAPARDSVAGNIITDSFSTGDLFYSPHFRTFLCVYFNALPGTFRLRYALEGRVEGKWSEAMELLDTEAGTKVPYNFAGHAYPGYDESGKTLLLSWTYEGNWTRMTRVRFE